MCNPNLLINTDFRNPVNQRGQSEYSVNAGDIRTIDCWTLQGNFSSATLVVDTGIVIFKSTGGNQGIKQNIEKEKMQVGEYYTISLFVDGVILSDSFKFDGTDIIKEYPTNNMISYAAINSENVIIIYPLIKYDTESKNFLIRASKLELGSFSTLANEVVDYATELRKCQRYLQKGTASFNTEFEGSSIYIPTGLLENTMRIAPTVRYYTKFGEGTVVNGHNDLYGKINGIFESKINRLPAIDVGNPAKIEDLVMCKYIASAEL